VTRDPLPYPRQWEADVVLTDGGTAHLRPITAEDADRLRAFHSRLSKETVYNRFFAYRPTLSGADVARFTQVDHHDRVALVATLQDEIIGVVRYDRLPGTTEAEVAFVVEDPHQGRGLGAVLLEHLAAAARERGVDRFVADVLPSNRSMLTVFRSAGYELRRDLADGYVSLAFPIRQTETSLEVMRSREHRAEARSVQRLLSPSSVAVIGASREPGAPGHELLKSLLRNGFEGPVYPVNPAATSVSGVRAYPDVRSVPDTVDLAVVAVPAAEVADVVRACAAKGVRGLVVVSGGFADAGPEGRARLDEVVRLARSGGMRLIGPNAMGVVNTDPAVRLHATFAPGVPPAGRVGVLSQSGALAGTFLAEAERRGLGLSAFVSIGDRADVSGNDLLQHWQADQRTEVVLLHLLGFGNPRKFTRIARRLGRTKPVIALKSGHGPGDVAVDALFASAGVVRVRSLGQLFTTAQLFALQPLPQGRRVGIVGNSSALAAMAADACREAGLEVADPDVIDLGNYAAAPEFRATLDAMLAGGAVDAVLAVVVPPPHGRHRERVAEQIGDVLRQVGSGPVPVLASFLGAEGVPPALAVRDDGGVPVRGSVPSYASPESAALALSRVVRYAEWRARPEGEVPSLPRTDLVAARAELAGLPCDGTWLSQSQARAVLAHVGIDLWPSELVEDLEAALRAASGLGWPVALKAADERWRNRIDVGAVRLGLVDRDDLRSAWQDVQVAAGRGPAFVQPMAAPGVSTVVRLVQDRFAGPLLSLRLGGVALDLLADPVTRTLPLTDLDAATLVRSIRGSQLLTGGLSGGQPADVGALEELLLRVARLGEELPEVTELVLDPVLVQRSGAVALHAGLRLLPAGSDPERGPRRLGASYAVL
jgi:acyl-CoA synthetase (NDP forming)/GNAT superfamily N-acetyltransferase